MVKAPNKKSRFKSLLENGYFPEELPPPFVTSTFAKYRNAIMTAWGDINNCPKTRPEIYSYPRVKHLRRNLAIVNPICQLYVAHLIADNWFEIRKKLNQTKYSIADMNIKQNEARAILKPDFHKNELKRLDVAASFSNILVSDVSRFYGTIYTHAIPWALHGKDWCKANMHNPAFKHTTGDKLDVAIRKGQDNQTIGIPIGPDTSRVISELIAISIDEKLEKYIKIDARKVFRNVDDWYIGFDGAGEAEDAIAHLASACKEFELELNSEKTEILLPGNANEPMWPTELRNHRISNIGRRQENGIHHFFLKSFHYASEHPEHNVLDYALKRARSFNVTHTNWPLLEAYICKCVRASPITMPTAAQILINYSNLGYQVNKSRISKLISDIIIKKAPVAHHGEVSWALFLAKGLRIPIQKKEAELISKIENSVCALIALDLRNMGLVSAGLNTEVWEQSLNSDGLKSNMWLLSYESCIKGWLKSTTPSHVNLHPQFKELQKWGVYFYDEHKNVPRIDRMRHTPPPPRPTYFSTVFQTSI